ncbi:MAG TPA: DUF1343 domain-containing protein [Bacteroidales bacterium]|nr:DUF1343 domain-containing protein [Bacteroidales bacterium]HQP04783.1 DUF1343 domain-containing protein [Bacteroidales bacterium]
MDLIYKISIPILILLSVDCHHGAPDIKGKSQVTTIKNDTVVEDVITGADQTEAYLPLLLGKRVALVANQTSICGNKHLVDTLVKLGIDVAYVFCPEHGFRGTAGAGDIVGNSTDTETGLSIVSLYGKNKKPQQQYMQNIDIVVFDLQDVGVRFYTYISTLHYVMLACAENNIPLIVLDRPNPNAHYIDGPVLDTACSSFIGMHPVPIVYGMTIGEYAKMINGEKWINTPEPCALTVIPCKNYTHNTPYYLPIPPSPNLPNDRSIQLYPTLCLFEGTCLSVGRGTEMQFQVIGHPLLKSWDKTTFRFTPKPNAGAAKPVLENQECFGFDFRNSLSPFEEGNSRLNISLLVEVWNNFPDKTKFFNKSFVLLAGTKKLQQQIESGMQEDEIRASWQEGIEEFKKIRHKYTIYHD